jgi:hypothetical protein
VTVTNLTNVPVTVVRGWEKIRALPGGKIHGGEILVLVDDHGVMVASPDAIFSGDEFKELIKGCKPPYGSIRKWFSILLNNFLKLIKK